MTQNYAHHEGGSLNAIAKGEPPPPPKRTQVNEELTQLERSIDLLYDTANQLTNDLNPILRNLREPESKVNTCPATSEQLVPLAQMINELGEKVMSIHRLLLSTINRIEL